MKEKHKNPVGRPKLADTRTKKNAVILLVISLVMVVTLIFTGILSIFNVNIFNNLNAQANIASKHYYLKPIPGISVGARYHSGGSMWKGCGYHTGVDYPASSGTKIFPIANGKVVYATGSGGKAASSFSIFGNHVIIQHPNGKYSLYAHMSSVNVKYGQNVSITNVIGLVGETGNVEGAHLHLEVWPKGIYPWSSSCKEENPLNYIDDNYEGSGTCKIKITKKEITDRYVHVTYKTSCTGKTAREREIKYSTGGGKYYSFNSTNDDYRIYTKTKQIRLERKNNGYSVNLSLNYYKNKRTGEMGDSKVGTIRVPNKDSICNPNLYISGENTLKYNTNCKSRAKLTEIKYNIAGIYKTINVNKPSGEIKIDPADFTRAMNLNIKYNIEYMPSNNKLETPYRGITKTKQLKNGIPKSKNFTRSDKNTTYCKIENISSTKNSIKYKINCGKNATPLRVAVYDAKKLYFNKADYPENNYGFNNVYETKNLKNNSKYNIRVIYRFKEGTKIEYKSSNTIVSVQTKK